MAEAVQAKCPNCEKVLRIPAQMVGMSMKCKHCGHVMKAKKKATTEAPPVPTPVTSTSSRNPSGDGGFDVPPPMPLPPRPVARPPQAPIPLDDLPEYTPPAATAATPPTPVASPPPMRSRLAPAPVVEELPEAAPTNYTPAFEEGERYTGRGKYKRRNHRPWGTYAAVGLLVVGLGVGAFVVVAKPELFKGKPPADSKQETADGGPSGDNSGGGQQNNNNPGPGTGGTNTQPGTGTRPGQVVVTGPMPRRMFAITATNYLYANPINYGRIPGTGQRQDFYRICEKWASAWKIPKDQLYFVTDGPLANAKIDEKRPPLKTVVLGSLDRFLDSCRGQDRIVVVFAGHAIEKDGKAYLATQEADLEDIPSMIPLEEVYAKLAKCKAQEKLIVFDVCRLNQGAGVERPIFGAMTPELEKVLHDSPERVSVWTSCSAGQHSYETDYGGTRIADRRIFESFGSIFLDVIEADHKGALTRSATGKGVQDPTEPLPVVPLSEYATEYTTIAVKNIEGKEQTPKLTYKCKDSLVAYDAKEPLAPKITLAEAAALADQKQVVAMFEEFRLPAIKASRRGNDGMIAASFPFDGEVLKEYAADSVTDADVRKEPEKYPVRFAVLEARDLMRKHGEKDEELPERFTEGQTTDAVKARILTFQRVPAKREAELQTVRDLLEEAVKKREMEKSKRWQANLDFMLAQVKARQVYISQYNLMLGKVRKDELPELVKKDDIMQTGWVLAAVMDIQSPAEMKGLAKEVKGELETLIKEHPNTPWALQAKRAKGLALGLEWKGTSDGGK